MGLNVWPVSNYTQQVPTLLWFHGNRRNMLGPTMLRVVGQQCCVRLAWALMASRVTLDRCLLPASQVAEPINALAAFWLDGGDKHSNTAGLYWGFESVLLQRETVSRCEEERVSQIGLQTINAIKNMSTFYITVQNNQSLYIFKCINTFSIPLSKVDNSCPSSQGPPCLKNTQYPKQNDCCGFYWNDVLFQPLYFYVNPTSRCILRIALITYINLRGRSRIAINYVVLHVTM